MAFDTNVVSKQRFLLHRDNAANGASVSTTDVEPASNVVRPALPSRSDNSTGIVRLVGDYDGENDITLDVLISASEATERRASEPQFVGAGTETVIQNLSVANTVAAQDFRVTMIDVGTDDENAKADFFGYWLVSRLSRTGGNNIRLTLNRSGLTLANSGYATPEDMSTDDYRFEGVGYDFGGSFELSANGELNSQTRRFQFGINPTVHRQYHAFENGKRVYYVDPPLPQNVAKGTRIRTVTGAYSVTIALDNSDDSLTWSSATAYSRGDVVIIGSEVFQVTVAGTSGGSLPSFVNTNLGDTTTDGGVTWEFAAATSSETFTGIITFFDLLQELLTSQLVELRGIGDVSPIVIPDKTPGGTAAEDPPFITDSYYNNFVAQGSNNIKKIDDIALSVTGDQSGQQISISCFDNKILGGSRFTVSGTGSGSIGEAKEGALFSSDGISFVIPRKNPSDDNEIIEEITNAQVQLSSSSFAANDGTSSSFPQCCIHQYGVGPNVVAETLTFTYQKRPDASCSCESVSFSADLDPNCFGGDQIKIFESADNDNTNLYAEIPAPIQSQIVSVRNWHRGIANGFFSIAESGNGQHYEPRWFGNVTLFNSLLNICETFLYQLYNALLAEDIEQGAFDTAIGEYEQVFLPAMISDAQLALVDTATTGAYMRTDGTTYPIKFNLKLQIILAQAGVKPSDPDEPVTGTNVGGASCWADTGAGFWWICESSLGNAYMPMFTNVPWYAAFESHDEDGNVSYVSAETIGMKLAIGCDEHLTPGDTITISIFAEPGSGSGDIKVNRFYNIDDSFEFNIVPDSPVELENGVSGDNQRKWSVIGTRAGRLSDYVAVVGSEGTYSQGGVSFAISHGETKNRLNDQFTFSILANQYQWRVDAGSYSTAVDMPSTDTLLTNGLSVRFIEGVGVSFEPNDLFSFNVIQPNAPAHILTPDDSAWRWPDATADIVIDFGTDQDISMIAIPWHGLPSGAGVSAQLLDSGDSNIGSAYILTWQQDGIFYDIGETISGVRKLELTLTSATDGWVSWVWAGEPLYLNTEADTLIVSRVRRMGGGDFGSRKHLARGYTAQIEWSGDEDGASGWVFDQDLSKLDDMFDSLKSNDDQAFAMITNITYGKAHMFRLAENSFAPADSMAYGLNDNTDQVFSASLNFREVFIS